MSLLAERHCGDAGPVGQCALTTAAEDTVQFVTAVTGQRVAHLVRGNEARKIFDPRTGAWPLTGSLAGRDNYRCREPRLMAACNQGTGRQTGQRCPSEAAGCHAAPKSQTKPGRIISVMIASLIRLCSVPRLVVAATVLRHDEVERADSLLEGRVTSEPVSESGIFRGRGITARF